MPGATSPLALSVCLQRTQDTCFAVYARAKRITSSTGHNEREILLRMHNETAPSRLEQRGPTPVGGRVTEPDSPVTDDGGEGGIRTLGGFDTSPVFKTGAINRSATSPSREF